MSIADNRVNDQSSSAAGEMRIITVQANVRELKEDEKTLSQLARLANWMPMVTNGEPTKLHVTAWLGHEGKNRNGLTFRAEDLPAAAERIGGANLLPMDWNHSAVVPMYDVPKAIGVWYEAKAKMNPAAKDGAGALGIEAKGVVWAWAFQEHAKEMLAMQQHRGYVEFSMACIPAAIELGEDADGRYEIAIEPVFFTLSALNVPPADPDARGMIDGPEIEDDEDSDDEMSDANSRQQLASLAANTGAAPEKNEDQPRVEGHHGQRAQEEMMDQNTQKALELALATIEELKGELATASGAKVELEAKITELETKLADALAQADDASLKRDALQAELATANEQIAALSTSLETANAQLAEHAAKEEKAVLAARWAARFEELPESYRAAFGKRSEEEQARFVERWSVASEEVWGEFKADLLVAFGEKKLSYLDLSKNEGKLPTSDGSASDLGARIAALIK